MSKYVLNFNYKERGSEDHKNTGKIHVKIAFMESHERKIQKNIVLRLTLGQNTCHKLCLPQRSAYILAA